MDRKYDKGQLLMVTLKYHTLEGHFHSQDEERTKIVLYDIISHEDNQKFISGPLTFHRSEVTSIRVIVDNPDARKEKVIPEDTLLMNNQIMLPYMKMPEEKPVLRPAKPRSEMGTRFSLSDAVKLKYSSLISDNAVYITSIEECYEPIKLIKHANKIGFGCESTYDGQKGSIRLVGISTKSHVYIFDTMVLKDAVFEAGLQDILEDPDICKIMHDCKGESNALFALHKIELNNVVDTQVMDLVVRKEARNVYPENAACLTWCLGRYLKLPEDLIFNERLRPGYKAQELARWYLRPLSSDLQTCFAKKVGFLLPLHAHLDAELNKEVYQGTRFNLDVRSLDEIQKKEVESLGTRYLPQKMRGAAVAEMLDKVDARVLSKSDNTKENSGRNSGSPVKKRETYEPPSSNRTPRFQQTAMNNRNSEKAKTPPDPLSYNFNDYKFRLK